VDVPQGFKIERSVTNMRETCTDPEVLEHSCWTNQR